MKIDILIDLRKFDPETLVIAGLVIGISIGVIAGIFICALVSSNRIRKERNRIYTAVENLYGSGKAADFRG